MHLTRRRRDRSRGVALVEFALVAPLLLLLLFGIMEFGWAFIQFLDVKHGAREAGRLAAVNYGSTTGNTQRDEIVDETCTRIDNPDGTTFTLTMPGGSTTGESVNVEVSRDFSSLTGFFGFLNVDLHSDVEVRLEQDATWAAGAKACVP